MHAHSFEDNTEWRDKAVLVVGMGNSAMDIAVEASFHARTTTWSVRRTEWVLRKFFLGRPSDQVALPGWLPWWVTAARLRIGATAAGIPVSTTHTITGSIVGVGSAKRFSAVKWGVAGRIVWAWVLTIPMAALIAALTYGVVLVIERLTGRI